MAKTFKKQSSQKKPAGEKFDSRRTQPTENADLRQVDKEEEKPWYKRTAVIAALIPVLAGVIISVLGGIITLVAPGIFSPPSPPPPLQHTFAGKVLNEQTGKAISGATVYLEAKNDSVDSTDSEGVFSFTVEPDIHQVKLRIYAEGYNPFDRKTDISGRNELEVIRLTPTSISQPTLTVTPQIKNRNGVEPSRTPSESPKIGKKAETRKEKERQAIKDLLSPGPSHEP